MKLVADAMNRTVVTVPADASVEEAEELARRTGVAHLLVVDEQTLVGILCACDLRDVDPGEPVSELMSLPVLTVRPDAPLEDAALTMGDCAVGCLPVALGGLLLGTVTDLELERAGLTAHPAGDGCHGSHDERYGS